MFIALISVESSWKDHLRSYNPKSDTWDCGLGQINSRNFDLFSKAYLDGDKFDPMNPYQNLRVAAAHLAELFNYYGGEVGKALVAYNVGMNGALKPRTKAIGEKYRDKIYKRMIEIRNSSRG